MPTAPCILMPHRVARCLDQHVTRPVRCRTLKFFPRRGRDPSGRYPTAPNHSSCPGVGPNQGIPSPMPAKPDQERTWSLGGRCHQNHVLPVEMRKGSGMGRWSGRHGSRRGQCRGRRPEGGTSGLHSVGAQLQAQGWRWPVPGQPPVCPDNAGRQSRVASRCAGWKGDSRTPVCPGTISWRYSQDERTRGRLLRWLSAPGPVPSSPLGHRGPSLGKATPWSLHRSAPG